MKRRSFIKSLSIAPILGATGSSGKRTGADRATAPVRSAGRLAAEADGAGCFPRLQSDLYLNAAGGSPLAAFSEEALERYIQYCRLGPGDGRDEIFHDTLASVRGEFAKLVGAGEKEIALVSCTKEGEQIILDSLRPFESGGNIVTNVFHFGGSLHNYEGHRRAGRDVRIVRGTGYEVSEEAMLAAIDEKTRLVCITLVSNLNGRIEPLKRVVARAHEIGAFVYADVIQAAGIMPLDLHALEVDFAACSAYKWLYAPHGVGFLYVREALQGGVLADRLYPGHSRMRAAPWSTGPAEPGQGALTYRAPLRCKAFRGRASQLPGVCRRTGGNTVHSGRGRRTAFSTLHGPCTHPRQGNGP